VSAANATEVYQDYKAVKVIVTQARHVFNELKELEVCADLLRDEPFADWETDAEALVDCMIFAQVALNPANSGGAGLREKLAKTKEVAKTLPDDYALVLQELIDAFGAPVEWAAAAGV